MKTEVDSALIARAAGGDRASAGALLESILPRVRNLIRYLLRGDAEVDDFAQQSLLAVLKGLPSYRGDGAFLAWVDRIVARTTFAALKKQRKREGQERDVELEALPTTGMDEYLLRRQVARWLDTLPENQRHAVVLHHVLGMSVPEIADTLSLPFDTVKSRLRLGMKRLRALTEELND